MKTKHQRIYAWVLTFAMIISLISVPGKGAKAAETSQDLTIKSGETSVTIAKNQYGDDYIGDMFFNIPSVMQTKTAMSSNKVTSMEVKITVKSFTQGTGDSARAMIFVQPDKSGSWKWNQSGAVNLAVGQQITLRYSFADMDWNGGTTMGNLGVRFANGADGSTVTYTVDSAKIFMTQGSMATAAPGGSTGADGDVSTDQVEIHRKPGDGSNEYYGEYSFSITNKSSQTIRGIQILIPTSQEVSVGYTNGFSATYDAEKGGVVVYYSTELAAGATVNSSDNKVGFSKQPSVTVGESYVIAVNCAAPSTGDDLQYELTGRKDVAYENTPVGRHGKLSVRSVDGYTAPVLVDQSGTPVQLRGASTHGMHWFPQYVNKNAFQTLRDDWGINLMRLVCYPRDVGSVGYLTGGDATKNQLDSLIQNGVDYATQLGMYAIVDWHVHAYNPNEYRSEAKTFFTKYATMYKDHDNVLYEICNEPTNTLWYDGSDNDLYTYCKEIIATIRAIDPDAVIICGTNTWSQDVEDVAAHPMKSLGYENIMYTFHFYAATHKDNLMNKVKNATKSGTPIFVTEFGITSADGNGSYDTDTADRWIALLNQLNISFACWSYSNCAEKSAYFQNKCNKSTGDWTASDLTTTGKWLINTCRAREEKELAGGTATAAPKPSGKATRVPSTKEPTASPKATSQVPVTKAPTTPPKATSQVPSTKEPTTLPRVTSQVPVTKAPTASPKVTSRVPSTKEPTASPKVTSQVPVTNAPTAPPKATSQAPVTKAPTTPPKATSVPVTKAPVNTPQTTAEAPNVSLKLLERTANTIRVQPSVPAENGKTYEYTLDGRSWQTETTFTGLEPATGYTVSVRYAQTEELAASPAAEQTLTTGTLVEDIYVIDLSRLDDPVYVDALYQRYDDLEQTTCVLYDNRKELTLSGTEKTYVLMGSGQKVSIILQAGVQISLEGVTCGKISGGSETDVTIKSGENQTGEIEAGSVTVKGGTTEVAAAPGSNKPAITADTITTEEGSLTAAGDGTAGALYAEKKISLIGGTLTVKAGNEKTGQSVIEVRDDEENVILVGDTQIVLPEEGAKDNLFSKDIVSTGGTDVKMMTVTYRLGEESWTVTVKQGFAVTMPDKAKTGFRLVWHKDNLTGEEYAVGAEYTVQEDVAFEGEYIIIEVIPSASPDTPVSAAPDQTPKVSFSAKPDQTPSDAPGNEPKQTPGDSVAVTPGRTPSGADTVPEKSPAVSTTKAPDQTSPALTATDMELSVDVKNVTDLPAKSKIQLAAGKSMQLKVTFLPEGAGTQKLVFMSSDASVVSVDSNGLIRAGKKAGSAVITVLAESGLKKTITVCVKKKAVQKIKIIASKKKLRAGGKTKLKAKITPGNKLVSTDVLWKSAKPDIAVVNDKGMVKAKKKGKVKITAYATDGSGRKTSITLRIK